MKRFKILATVAATSIPFSLMATSCGQHEEKDVYRDININKDWEFELKDKGDKQTINLPHDFSIMQDFVQPTPESKTNLDTSGTTGFLPGGIGYYHNDLKVLSDFPQIDDNTSVILNFDGAYNDTEVKVGHELVGTNKYGYNPFAFDITDYLDRWGGPNYIDVTVKHEHVTSSRWYPGSGIYRDVTLSILDKLHVAHNGTYVTTPNLKFEVGKTATVKVDVEVQNNYDEAKQAYVRNRVIDYSGKPVTNWFNSSKAMINAKGTNVFNCQLKVKNPKLWSAETPNLYYVETQVLNENKIVDKYKTRFGFRFFEWDEKGFRVNGKLTKIHGVCLHHDQGALGSASYDDAMYRQLLIMKEMGVNGIRTSHGCPDQDFLRMCDELGFYVSDEAFDTWEFAKTAYDSSTIWKEWLGQDNHLIDGSPEMTWHNFVMRSMVKRDRNCPSIFMWSLGNELHEGLWHDPISQEEKLRIEQEMLDYARELRSIANELDYDPHTQRWSGIALERDPNPGSDDENIPKCRIAKMLYNEGGVMGFNYGEASQTATALGQLDPQNPQPPLYKRLYGSETASANNSRGYYGAVTFNSDQHDQYFRVPSYDITGSALASEVIWRTLYYDGYAGQFVWTGFDYIGEPSPWCWNVQPDRHDPESWKLPEQWPYPNSSYFGIVDTCGFPKDSYYLYRAHLRQDDTTLHLVGSLNDQNMFKYTTEEGFPAGFTPIDIYTNAPTVVIKDEQTKKDIAQITRSEQETSLKAGHYYTYEAQSLDESVCKIHDSQIKINNSHGLYSNILVDPTKVNHLVAEAYDEQGNKIENTVGLSCLDTIDRNHPFDIVCYSNKNTIKADGKSLAYITVDLEDANGTLITDYDSQIPINVSLVGSGKILGVDNGDQLTLEKWQNQTVLNLEKTTAHIKTYAGKALIIVSSTENDTSPIILDINGHLVEIQAVA